LLTRLTREHEIESCIHFAALAYVGESVERPADYFENNAEEGVAMASALEKAGVRRFVLSSTAAVYGEPKKVPIVEDSETRPKNPYGWSKLFLERLHESFDTAYGWKFMALRYFNAAGATEKHGEDHEPETHLIPNVLATAEVKSHL
jgi:UDP-glucose 4-epimerase